MKLGEGNPLRLSVEYLPDLKDDEMYFSEGKEGKFYVVRRNGPLGLVLRNVERPESYFNIIPYTLYLSHKAIMDLEFDFNGDIAVVEECNSLKDDIKKLNKLFYEQRSVMHGIDSSLVGALV